ncbi:MAG: nucleoside-diphosphate sugar epimerase [Lysinibacillus sp.]
MLKIKSIEYIKVVYDESLSHNIFSIANVTFSNFEPILGALLYWRVNDNKENFTNEGDYKFYYDMANTMYYAAVKFPKHVKLSSEQKQELAYILLEERGSVGSYSFSTSRKNKSFSIRREFYKLQFPTSFKVDMLPVYIKSIVPQYELDLLAKDYPDIPRDFWESYAKWRYNAAQLHPEVLQDYIHFIDFRLICAINPMLTENFLLEQWSKIDFSMLSTNYTVLHRLSEPFKAYLYTQIEQNEAKELELFLEQDEPLNDEYLQLLDEDEVTEMDLEYFTYDLGANKWPGAEHLVKGIPSLAAQAYDAYGYRKKTNKEMDAITKGFDETQWRLASTIFDLHWLHRYKKHIDWTACSLYNPNLTESFLITHIKLVDFAALGQNVSCQLTPEFIEKYMNRFNHQQPVPLVIRHLTEQLYLQYKDTIQLNNTLLLQYGDTIDDEEFFALQALLDEQ